MNWSHGVIPFKVSSSEPKASPCHNVLLSLSLLRRQAQGLAFLRHIRVLQRYLLTFFLLLLQDYSSSTRSTQRSRSAMVTSLCWKTWSSTVACRSLTSTQLRCSSRTSPTRRSTCKCFQPCIAEGELVLMDSSGAAEKMGLQPAECMMVSSSRPKAASFPNVSLSLSLLWRQAHRQPY